MQVQKDVWANGPYRKIERVKEGYSQEIDGIMGIQGNTGGRTCYHSGLLIGLKDGYNQGERG